MNCYVRTTKGHAIVEFSYEGKVYHCDLGGITGRFKIHEINLKQRLADSNLKTQPATRIQPKQRLTLGEYKQKLLLAKQESGNKKYDLQNTSQFVQVLQRVPETRRNGLVTVNSLQEVHALYVELNQMAKNLDQKIIYIDNIDNLQKTVCTINENGSISEIPSPFVNWLREAKIGDFLVINVSDFKSVHNSGLNALLDFEHRRAFEIPVPDGVLVICLLDEHHQYKLGDSFFSRIPLKG